DLGSQDDIGARLLRLGIIVVKVPWVRLKVLVGPELERVHEDADRNYVALRCGAADVGAMAPMQGSHCWVETNALARAARLVQKVSQVLWIVGDYHLLLRSYRRA